MERADAIAPHAYSMPHRAAAWLVHLYTATGGLFGMIALIDAARLEVRSAFFWLIAAMLIDVTDGMLARRVRVREVLPRFNGAYLDNTVDVLTYIYVPIFIIGWAGLLPHPAWTAAPLIAGMYAYGQEEMKTEDHFFLGFPSYWNVVALYLYWLEPPAPIALAMVLVPAILTFVPTRYLYPSRNSAYWRSNWLFGGLWFLLVFWLLVDKTPDRRLILLSLLYPAYYLFMSFYVDHRVREEARRTGG